jgi:hypothetical protein
MAEERVQRRLARRRRSRLVNAGVKIGLPEQKYISDARKQALELGLFLQVRLGSDYPPEYSELARREQRLL